MNPELWFIGSINAHCSRGRLSKLKLRKGIGVFRSIGFWVWFELFHVASYAKIINWVWGCCLVSSFSPPQKMCILRVSEPLGIPGVVFFFLVLFCFVFSGISLY